ncbi:MAG: outer membrane protein assembly factor BamE [Acidisphaera sp.]|nr:outer membrane protein assembly factor BamE [Acidisphaera sp.]
MRRRFPLSRLRPAAWLPALALLAGCSFFQAPSQVRGNKVDLDALHALVPGTSTRTDASSLLGSPTAHASFDDNTWIYIGEVTRPEIASTQSVLKQQVVVLTFDQSGVLRDVRTLDKKNSLPVSVVARSTPSPGSSASFMQQLLGNVGRFNAPSESNSVPGGAAPGASE